MKMNDLADAIPSGDSRADRSIKESLGKYTLLLDRTGRAYAIPKEEPNAIALAIQGSAFKKRLRKDAHQRGDLLRSDDLALIIDDLNAHAAIQDEPVDIYLRVGPSTAGGIEIDLGTPDRARVHLHSGTATVIKSDSQTLFYRSETLRSLPIPALAGDWRQLLPHLNMPVEDKLLLIACLTFYLCHYKYSGTAFPILVIKGEHGTGKSTLCRHVIRGLVDNNASDVQMFPKDQKDLLITSANQHIVIYDNLRVLSKLWSDTLCVACTGGSLSTRKLYTDSEESLLPIHTPLVLNGIHSFITEPDLASRTVSVTLDRLTEHQRRSDSELLAEFDQKKPAIFRGLLTLAAQALQGLNDVQPQYKSRLTEFTRWLASLELAMGLESRYLQDVYHRNVLASKLDTITENPLAMAIIKFAKDNATSGWSGTPTELLTKLEAIVGDRVTNRSRQWPQNPIAMSKRLKVIAGILEEQGLFIEFRHTTTRMIDVRYTRPEKG
jgi:hypothetical protein